jgi:pyridoxal phosphate enzyme (YggS family)
MIHENLARIREKIASSCARVGKSPQEITIVAVSKGRSLSQIQEALDDGISDIGENKVREALCKYNAMRRSTRYARQIRWHMVGHLQTNKAKEAVRIFDLIQSVDSQRIAKEIDTQADRIGKVQDVLIEIKMSPEPTRSGIIPDEAPEMIGEMSALKNINIIGLMTIAPIVDNPEKTRLYFRMLRQLKDKINAQHITHKAIRVLSMGMTDDFGIALEEGSTMVRLGRAIFGNTDKHG